MNKIKELEKRERDIRIEINELKYKEQIEKHVPFIKSLFIILTATYLYGIR